MNESATDLRGKRVLVFGLGVHGGATGVARFLVEQGAIVTATDLRTEDKLAEGLAELEGLPITYVLGKHRERDILSADLILRNPAVPRESRWLQLAHDKGIPVLMEMNLFWERCPAPITAITGSKGKSTTTAWLGHVLSMGRPDTVIAGNIRVSALEALPSIKADTPVVLELSSFQLEALEAAKVGPHVSCVTNMAPDHLNRYRDMEDYANAKRVIYRYQSAEGYAIFNRDDPIVSRFAGDCPARVLWFSRERFPGDGAYLERKWVTLRREGKETRVVSAGEIGLPGEHNVINALAVVALASANDVPVDQIAEGLRKFRGLPHRMELVEEIEGVRYINDTASTVPVSTVTALRSLDSPIVLIAGGASKRVPFDGLANEICDRVRRLVLLEGSATSELQTEVYKRCPAIEMSVHDSLQSAVEDARREAKPGDTVLLSPACASFGMFDNEFQRGDIFRRIVREMKQGS